MENKVNGFPHKRGKPKDIKDGTPPDGGVPILSAVFVGFYIRDPTFSAPQSISI